MLSSESRPQKGPAVLTPDEASGELVLLHIQKGECYALDEVGARIWELCDGEQTVDGIVSALCDEFEAPRDTVQADVLELIRELVDEKLLLADKSEVE